MRQISDFPYWLMFSDLIRNPLPVSERARARALAGLHSRGTLLGGPVCSLCGEFDCPGDEEICALEHGMYKR